MKCFPYVAGLSDVHKVWDHAVKNVQLMSNGWQQIHPNNAHSMFKYFSVKFDLKKEVFCIMQLLQLKSK